MLRFANGDQLHGTFMGVKAGPKVVWQRDDLQGPVDFETSKLRHVVLRDGRASKPLGSLSYAGLVNGDRVPGRIIEIGEEEVVMEAPYAGEIRLPREQVGILAPNPLGGRVYYNGPFVKDGWKMIEPPSAEKDEGDGEQEADDDQGSEWMFSGSAWYWQGGEGGVALARDEGMADRSVLSFDLVWKSRLSVAIAFHADFRVPKPDEEDEKRRKRFVKGDVGSLPHLFGNS